MDEADFAFVVEERARISAIEAQRQPAVRLHPIGVCYYCDSQTTGKKLFCDSVCATKWDQADKQRRSTGGH